MSDCERVLARLSPFLDRELPDGERGEILVHLEICPPCKHVHQRYLRLEEISVRCLAGAPGVAPTEWTARWKRIDADACNPRSIARRERRERMTRFYFGVFAMAASVIVAATLALPLIISRPEGHGIAAKAADHEHLCFLGTPGSNQAEVVEVSADDNHSIVVDYPAPDSGDAVVIMISKQLY